MSKQPQSGLKTLQRHWSMTSGHSSSQPIPWEPTPPRTSASAPKKELSGLEKRLKDIQDALAGGDDDDFTPKPLRTSTNALNRPPKRSSNGDDGPPKKRVLPNTWSELSITHAKKVTMTNGTAPPRIVAATPSGPPKKIAPVFLSHEQTQILRLVGEGHSIFYTGSAGTGKSVLLREIIKTLKKKHIKSADAVAITASTGIAACNIGGVTIHSFAGIGLGIEPAEALVDRIRKNKKASSRWARTKVLIIDEVSMVDGDLFDKLSRIGELLRRKPGVPFGGIQTIVTGDFFQLPPVGKGSTAVKFAFEANAWPKTIKRTFNLTKVFRQRDEEFVDMLNEMRFGRLSQKSIEKFRSLSREIEYEDGLGATELFPRRDDVDRSNSGRMHRLSGEPKTYFAIDTGMVADPQAREKMTQNFMAPKQLTLRLNAQVMLIKNMDETLVNGSIGKVVEFIDPAQASKDLLIADEEEGGSKKPKSKTAAVGGGGLQYPVVEFNIPGGGTRRMLVTPEAWKVELPNGEVQVQRSQLPLILAWAMSIHKSQGQTLDRVKVDLGRIFEKGQAYVALSRATSLEGLQVLNFDPVKVMAHPKVAEWSKTLEVVELNE